MDELLEKKTRALKLKLLMAEKELHASSGKWKLGALLGAGHASAMNREVIRVKDRLESRIEKLKEEIEALESGTTPQATTAKPSAQKIAKTPPVVAAKKAPAKKAVTSSKTASKKSTGKK